MSDAIATFGLGKSYGAVRALDALSLAVHEGEVFGYLGPNGAGKTTTIRLLLGLIRPTAGSFAIAPREEIGYLPGELALWPELTGRETLDLLARLAARAPVRREALCERLGLRPADLARRVRTYSDGMKQKLGIVQALQSAPRVALLDEPTKGLDPLVQQAFYEVIAELRREGVTVFFSSHILSEVERVCDRVAMVRAGRLMGVDDVDTLRRTQRRRVRAVFAAPLAPAELGRLGAVAAADGATVDLLVAQAELPALLARLAGLPLLDLEVERPRLEDVFLEQYR
jgi:ABC-2 type transport system ATP-binding protein